MSGIIAPDGREFGRWLMTPELIHSLVRAAERSQSGTISPGACVVEQMEAFFAVNPDSGLIELQMFIAAFKLYLNGDDTLLELFLGAKPGPKFRALKAKRRVKRGRRS